MDLTPEAGASSVPIISVRREAERTADPDSVILRGHLSATREDKPAALQAAALAVDSLKSGLAEHGGVALSASTARAALTWSVQRVGTHPDKPRA